MTATFVEIEAADNDMLFNSDEFGKPAVYYPKQGDEKTVTVLVMETITPEIDDKSSLVTMVLCVRKTDIPEPGYKEKISFMGKDWVILRSIKEDGLNHHIKIEREERRALWK